MPGNVYGVARPGALPATFGPASDVSCPSATETTVVTTGALTAPQPGDYFVVLDITLVIYMGATAPTALVIAARFGALADFASYTVDPGQLTANAKVQFNVTLTSPNSPTNFAGGGSTVNLTVNPTGQTVTAKQVGSSALAQIFYGPDA